MAIIEFGQTRFAFNHFNGRKSTATNNKGSRIRSLQRLCTVLSASSFPFLSAVLPASCWTHHELRELHGLTFTGRDGVSVQDVNA